MKISTSRGIIGAAGVISAATVLAWGVGFGAVKPDARFTPPKIGVADRVYMGPRAAFPIDVASGQKTVHSWRFSRGLPLQWQRAPGLRVSVRGGVSTLTTNSNANDVQARSSAVNLRRGSYWLIVGGAVSYGGLQLGLETADGQRCESAAYFGTNSTSPGRPILAVRFVVERTGSVRAVLANWAQRSLSSVWRVRRIWIAEANAPKATPSAQYSSVASPLLPLKLATAGTPLFRWALTEGLPAEWLPAPGVSTKRGGSSLIIHTTREQYGYQLTMVLQLKPGSYVVWLDGRMIKGGLTLGAENLETGKWLKTNSYWHGQRQSSGVMGTRFSLRRQTNVELVLANWSPTRSRSSWQLRGIEIDQLF
jgi:hypothetical protein